jgi:predicted Zn-dependent protease
MNRVAFALVATSLVSGAHSQMFKPSKDEQIKAGQDYAAEIRKKEKLLPDNDPRVVLLRQVGQQILDTRTDKEKQTEPWKFSFDVIDSKEVNAFAVPGGPIFFFTGLLDRFQTIDELAGVMGHEIIHIRREHWASAVNSAQEKEAGLLILGELFGVRRQQMTVLQAIKQIGIDVANGRGQERESDEYGFRHVVQAGYNPEGMARVFEMFRAMKGSGSGPEWLSTHPDDVNRIKKIRSLAVENLKKKPGKKYPEMRPLPFETEAMRQAKLPKAPASGTTKPSGTS